MADITFYGGAGSVTGANFLLNTGKDKVLVDCGYVQGSAEAHALNKQPFEYEPAEISRLFVTHGHIDHIGRIPKLVKDGFKGEIWSTPETKSIAELLLLDAVKVGREDSEPIYTTEHVSRSLGLWRTFPYHEERDFGEFSVEAFDAGHILGSSMLKFTFPSGKSLLFSGDIGNSPSLLLKDTEEVKGVDYLVMESVYGDRNHENREEREEKFKKIVRENIERGGTLLIPSFSLERTQGTLYMLDNLFESGELPAVPVFIDSPLATKITAIYERVTKHYNEDVQAELSSGDKIFSFSKLRHTPQIRDSQEIANVKGTKIIIAGSGMSTGGRIVGHEAAYLPDPNATILFMGYQAPGTLGRQIEEGAKEVEIDERIVKVRARVEKIEGFSAHADSDALVRFASVNKETLKQVFVAMGEPRAAIFLAQRLHDELGLKAVVPKQGETYKLEL